MDTKTDKTIVDNNVIREMIETEKTYNNALTLLVSAFDVEENINGNLLLIEFKRQISILKGISDAILQQAENAVNPTASESEHRAFRSQRTQLLKAFFSSYQSYAEIYSQFAAESRENPEQFRVLSNYIDLQTKTTTRLGISDLLIMPVQRGPRYSLLVKEVRKNDQHLTENNKAEFEELEALIKGFLFQSNEKLRSGETSDDKYWFGKITYGLLFGTTKPEALTLSPVAKASEPESRYQFGDLSRNAYLWFTTKSLTAQPSAEKVATESETKKSIDDGDETDEGFVILSNPAENTNTPTSPEPDEDNNGPKPN